uniref:MI domain-containing protein n=1 Tax=Glossina palpalis gambiensis TaxID=67801 RepID=A0A1B0BJ65_9MUSC
MDILINSQKLGELLLKRLVVQFKRAFLHNDKNVCLPSTRFISHIVNQRLVHKILALEILTLPVEMPTDDSVEVAIAFLKECGVELTEVSSKGAGTIFEMLKNILQIRQTLVFRVRKDGFKDHQSVIESLELVEENDQFTHLLTLDEATDLEESERTFKNVRQVIELCHMFLNCCAEQRTYEKFYGLLAQRFCAINKIYVEPFEEIFKDTYQTTHTNRLPNVSKFFAHLLFTDAIGWDVLECIKLNEEDTTSSSHKFIKILFQELVEYTGLSQLNRKLKDEALLESLAGVFPKSIHPKKKMN